jgi:hypothetical protein
LTGRIDVSRFLQAVKSLAPSSAGAIAMLLVLLIFAISGFLFLTFIGQVALSASCIVAMMIFIAVTLAVSVGFVTMLFYSSGIGSAELARAPDGSDGHRAPV